MRWTGALWALLTLMRQHLKLALNLSRLDLIAFVYYFAHEMSETFRLLLGLLPSPCSVTDFV